MARARSYRSFREFYPFYLSQHADRTCRRLHVIGSAAALLALLASVAAGNPWLLILVPVFGYGFAWVAHIAFEKNRPATFTHPLYSLAGDWVMFWRVLTGRLPF